MSNDSIIIVGNKPSVNLNLDRVLDSFNDIYRFNLCVVGKNNGTKFGKLAMCCHIYRNYMEKQYSIDQTLRTYGSELEETFLREWYDFFHINKNKYKKIYYQPNKMHEWNNMLNTYGCSYRFSRSARTGYSTIFENLKKDNKIYVTGFTLIDDEIQKTMGEINSFAEAKNKGLVKRHHNFVEESKILAWLHNNGKIDASLCMLKDTAEPSFEKNSYNTEPSDFIISFVEDLI